MAIEEFFNEKTIVDLSFFNFRNSVTAAYFANEKLEVQKVNENFRSFFPILGNVTNVYFPDVLEQLGVSGEQIDHFVREIKEEGQVLIPEVQIEIEGDVRVYSLLSTCTTDSIFSYLNGVQGQFVDRTQEWYLKRDKEALLEQQLKNQELIASKTRELERLANRLAQYLSPQIYETIFSGKESCEETYTRKNLTVFFSDIVQFTDMSDSLEPEKLATVINSYLSEMTQIVVGLSTSLSGTRFWSFSVIPIPEANGRMRSPVLIWRPECRHVFRKCRGTGRKTASPTALRYGWGLLQVTAR